MKSYILEEGEDNIYTLRINARPPSSCVKKEKKVTDYDLAGLLKNAAIFLLLQMIENKRKRNPWKKFIASF